MPIWWSKLHLQHTTIYRACAPGPLLLTWINFNPSMAKYLHPILSVGWNYISIHKLQRRSRWSLWMDKKFHHTFYWACNYFSMPGTKSIYVSERRRSWQCYYHKTYGVTEYGHNMKTLSALLALCGENTPVTGGSSPHRTNNAELWCFFYLCCWPGQPVDRTVKLLVIEGAMTVSSIRLCDVIVMFQRRTH